MITYKSYHLSHLTMAYVQELQTLPHDIKEWVDNSFEFKGHRVRWAVLHRFYGIHLVFEDTDDLCQVRDYRIKPWAPPGYYCTWHESSNSKNRKWTLFKY